MNAVSAVFRREFAAYFATPIAFVFMGVFLVAMGVFTFYVGRFYDMGVADLTVFFSYHPWLYLFLIPALAMRLWAEEKRSGTIELLLTLPLPVWATVLGKYLAAWAFAGLALALTFPIWLTANYLGDPDNGVILASYIGSFLVAGTYLAIGAAISAATTNQVVAFVVAVAVSFLFTAAGAPLVMEALSGWAPVGLVETVSSFSFLTHFSAITQGVIDLRDAIFFLSLTGLCLFANMLIVERGKEMKLSSRAYFWTALGLATAAFVGLNVFAGNFFIDARLDLTQSRQYTLSDGTRAVIAKLPEPVTLRFYFSRRNSADYPATAAYAKRVRDLLGHYAAISHGRIVLEDIDPAPFTPEEDRANEAGLRAAPLASGSGSVYFGLEGVNMVDDRATIPFFAPEREPYLEYDLTALLYQLSHPGKRKVAVLSSLPLERAPGSGQKLGIYADLERSYEVTKLAADFREIPKGTDLLLIAHPQEVVPSQMSAIMRYSLTGGRILLLLDPMSELVQQEQAPSAPPSSDLHILLQAWGVEYTPAQLVLDRGTAQLIRNPRDPQRASVPYPLWQHLTAANFSKNDPVTASLNGVNLASPGALAPAKGATTKFEPLLSSSADSMLFSRDETLNLRDPGALMSRMKPGGKPLTLAARITGRAVFPNVAEGNVNIVVIADTDVLDDRFWAQTDPESGARAPFADNQGLILNAIESLTGSDDLIGLRARGNTERPFTVVRAMQAEAEARYRQTLDSLRGRLQTAQEEFARLQQGGSAATLSEEQNAAMERLQREMAGTRAQLRDVQANLRAGIDRLGRVLAFLNILLVPLLVAGFALVYGVIRRGRAKGPRKAGAAA